MGQVSIERLSITADTFIGCFKVVFGIHFDRIKVASLAGHFNQIEEAEDRLRFHSNHVEVVVGLEAAAATHHGRHTWEEEGSDCPTSRTSVEVPLAFHSSHKVYLSGYPLNPMEVDLIGWEISLARLREDIVRAGLMKEDTGLIR